MAGGALAEAVMLAAASPNFGPRRDGQRPELIVIHYTAMQSCAASAARLCDAEAEVSAHYLIDYDGTIYALVDEAARAWHAGAGAWAGREDVNSRSIGIELQNRGDEPFPEPQMAALAVLLAQIMARWQIAPEGVIGHSDMAPGRKHDPGARFDWARLARQGLAVWPEVAPVATNAIAGGGRAAGGAIDAGTAGAVKPDPATAVKEHAARQPAAQAAHDPGLAQAFDAALSRFGYPQHPTALRLQAFRLRFRPWAGGPLDAVDLALAADLAKRFPVVLPPALSKAIDPGQARG